jgi:NAD(P)-dependent dehydrogenase (short-subunit alcohol dehydrogenase family)
MRRELAPHGVQVVIVEPGAVRTEMSQRGISTADRLAASMTPAQSERYGRLMQAITAQAAAFTRAGLPAEKAALVIARAVTTRRPRTRYTIGRDAALLTRLSRILPDRLLDRILAANLRPSYPKLTAPAVEGVAGAA